MDRSTIKILFVTCYKKLLVLFTPSPEVQNKLNRSNNMTIGELIERSNAAYFTALFSSLAEEEEQLEPLIIAKSG